MVMEAKEILMMMLNGKTWAKHEQCTQEWQGATVQGMGIAGGRTSQELAGFCKGWLAESPVHRDMTVAGIQPTLEGLSRTGGDQEQCSHARNQRREGGGHQASHAE
eukprot:802145-Pelagomonas_calceolata.AAC.2